MIKKIEVERFTLSSSKPFDQVVAGSQFRGRSPGHPGILEINSSGAVRRRTTEHNRKSPRSRELGLLPNGPPHTWAPLHPRGGQRLFINFCLSIVRAF